MTGALPTFGNLRLVHYVCARNVPRYGTRGLGVTKEALQSRAKRVFEAHGCAPYSIAITRTIELMAAYTNKSEKSLAQALATYRYYKENYAKDYQATFEDDRMEGTAYYYEIRSSLFAGYPDKVKTMKQNDQAVRTLFKQNRLAYLDSGAYAETYNVGALASFILDWQADKQGISRDTWKKAMASAKTNPMDYLDKHAKIFYIPPYKATMTNAEYKTMYKKILNYKNLAN